MDSFVSRRTALKSSLFGLMAVSFPNVLYAKNIFGKDSGEAASSDLFYRYPALSDDIVSEVVGAAHFNFERVKKLVDQRPELARASWDWRFGDWESAIGASSHMGRRDIVQYLIEKGARPDIFTFAMLGEVDAVQSIVKAFPGIQTTSGPHGITLMDHARVGLRSGELSDRQKNSLQLVIEYLESIEGADQQPVSQEMSASEKEKYLGNYRYGDGDDEVLVVDLNMRELLSIGRKGTFGGTIDRVGDHRFVCRGCSSVELRFVEEEGTVTMLTVYEPDLIVKAIRI